MAGFPDPLTLLVYIAALAVVVLAPILYDSHHAYQQRRQLIEALSTHVTDGLASTSPQVLAAVDAVAKKASDVASKSVAKDPVVAAEEVAKAASDLAESYTDAPTRSAARTVAKAAADAKAKVTSQDKPEKATQAVATAASDAAKSYGETRKSLIDIADKLIDSPEGMTGEGRLAMTLGFVVIIGIVVIQLLMMSNSLTASVVNPPTPLSNQTLTYAQTTSASLTDTIKTVVTILSGAVTAMVGFYFGQKAAEKPAAPAATTTPTTPTP
jgi:hypothetical protein